MCEHSFLIVCKIWEATLKLLEKLQNQHKAAKLKALNNLLSRKNQYVLQVKGYKAATVAFLEYPRIHHLELKTFFKIVHIHPQKIEWLIKIQKIYLLYTQRERLRKLLKFH